jgi:ribosome-associated toxin RatA of RatAB toxin-antitoxin module
MNEIRRSALVPYPVDYMFDLIESVEHYPDFLPWCAAATVLARDESVISARITVDYHGARFSMATRNAMRRPEFMDIRLEKGPFRLFHGEWHLAPLADTACRIEFCLSYEFQNLLTAKLAGAVLDRAANTLVNAFVTRAEQLHGRQPAGNC